MIRPTIYGQAIILLTFAPLLTFTGVEGKTFSPMAITMMLALASAFVLSLTFVPAMIAVLLNKKLTEKEVKPIVWAKERRSEEHTSELQSLMRISYAVFCLKKKKTSKLTDYTST